jgi:hypothetical protein
MVRIAGKEAWMPDLSFVLLRQPAQPDPVAIVTAAAELGLALTPGEGKDEVVELLVEGGGHLFVMMVPVPHPDAPKMPVGPLSPTMEEMEAASAHCIVTVMGVEGDERTRDRIVAILTGAVIRTLPAVAAMLGHGVLFQRADLFADFARLAAEEGELPLEICVDVTAAPEDDERMSFLTHGMTRYGGEEIYVTCPVQGEGALDYIFTIARWMFYDPDVSLPTGDTVGRTEEEKITVQRVPSPTGEGPEVIRLDLPS